MYSTITTKGQITLPASWRRQLNLESGQKVAMREVDGAIIIDPPQRLANLRMRARAEMEAAGTWGMEASADQGWVAAVADKMGR